MTQWGNLREVQLLKINLEDETTNLIWPIKCFDFFLREVQLLKLNLEDETTNLIWQIKLIKNEEFTNLIPKDKIINLTWTIRLQEGVKVPKLWPNEKYWGRYNFSNKWSQWYRLKYINYSNQICKIRQSTLNDPIKLLKSGKFIDLIGENYRVRPN